MTGTGGAADAQRGALEAQPLVLQPAAAGDGGAAANGSHLPDEELDGFLHPRPATRWERFVQDPMTRTVAVNLALTLTWYFFSTLLSLFNKKVVGKEHGFMELGPFPAPFFLSSAQFFLQHLIARAVLMTGLVRRKSDGSQSWKDYARKVVPNGVATGLDIGFSNYSLVYITLSFYVMCKSTTPLFLLVFAIAWGLEKPSWSLAAVVSVISCGLLLLVYGETKFHLVGFILVMVAAMLAGLRWTITQVLLQGSPGHGGGHGSRKHGGPVEVLYQLTPVMGITLLLLSLAHERLWDTLPSSRYFESFGMGMFSFAIIAVCGLVAFCMVVAEFALIGNTSALTFMVAGTFKELVTVAAAVVFLGESFTWINGMGLLVLIMGVVLFNWMKYKKIRAEMAATESAGGARKHTDEHEGGVLGPAGPAPPGSSSGGSGSEVEMHGGAARGWGGGGGGGGEGPLAAPSPRHSGGEHTVLMLGVREGFLLEDKQVLSELARTPRSASPGSAAWRQRGGGGRQPGSPGGSPHSA